MKAWPTPNITPYGDRSHVSIYLRVHAELSNPYLRHEDLPELGSESIEEDRCHSEYTAEEDRRLETSIKITFNSPFRRNTAGITAPYLIPAERRIPRSGQGIARTALACLFAYKLSAALPPKLANPVQHCPQTTWSNIDVNINVNETSPLRLDLLTNAIRPPISAITLSGVDVYTSKW
jgi:hypothetical protein